MPWSYNTDLSKVQWKVKYVGVSFVQGLFRNVQAKLDLEGDDPTTWAVDVEIAAASLDSGYERMDEHVRSADFLDVERCPTITFRSKRVERAGDHYRLIGDLTIHFQTREVALDAWYHGES